MQSLTQSELLAAKPVQAPVRAGESHLRRRRISPQAGRGLEILGHAIEYLTDEFVHQGGSFTSKCPQVEAMQVLMALNRKIYLDCPEVPTWSERFLALLHLRAA